MNHLIFTGGGGVPKNEKKLLAGGKAGKKLFANSLSIKNCLHGNFKEFANLKISTSSKDAFLLQLIRQHSITFLYKFQSVHMSFMRHIIIIVFPLTVIKDSTIQQAVSEAACNSKLN